MIVVVAAICLWMALGYVSVWNIEQPSYTAVDPNPGSAVAKADNIELRTYDSVIVAESTVNGPYEEAVNNGFRLVADYIFGNNTADTSVAMTSPVLQEQVSPTTISMTAPVLQSETEGGKYTISFVMPAKYTIDTIPKPNHPSVMLREISDRLLGVISFSGRWTDQKAVQYTHILQRTLEEDGYTLVSQPQFARYNPPWTPPWMMHNEIWIQVR